MLKKIVAAVMLLVLVALPGCGKRQLYLDGVSTEYGEGESSEGQEEPAEEQMEQPSCAVYVCGAVRYPGVYELASGSRICDAIEAAGGFSEEACQDCLNQAEYVADGQMIRVLTREEREAQGTREPESEVSDGKVNINTATAAELVSLPGVGSAKAEAILSYREQNGAFSAIEELMNIPGIKEGVFNRIKDQIKVK